MAINRYQCIYAQRYACRVHRDLYIYNRNKCNFLLDVHSILKYYFHITIFTVIDDPRIETIYSILA